MSFLYFVESTIFIRFLAAFLDKSYWLLNLLYWRSPQIPLNCPWVLLTKVTCQEKVSYPKYFSTSPSIYMGHLSYLSMYLFSSLLTLPNFPLFTGAIETFVPVNCIVLLHEKGFYNKYLLHQTVFQIFKRCISFEPPQAYTRFIYFRIFYVILKSIKLFQGK